LEHKKGRGRKGRIGFQDKEEKTDGKTTTTIVVLWETKHKQLWKSGESGEKPHE